LKEEILKIAQMIEYVPKIGGGYEDLDKLCEDAMRYRFKTVAVGESSVAYCKNILKGSGVNVSAGISFPFGQTTIEAKVFEAKDAIKLGADEVEYVVNIAEVKRQNEDYISKEMDAIVTECRKRNVSSKVIFENCYLSKDEIIFLCKIASKVKPDFIKTTTGFGSGGATVEDVKLMRKYASSDIKIKAAAGIHDLKTLYAMVEAGANRIGTSHAIKIIKELQAIYI
jgi:deoxyribose-phosphate aldolase